MSIKAIIDDKEVELKPDQLQLGEGYGLITPDNVPKGYFTQEALDNVVQDRLKKERDKVKSSLAGDSEFHKSIFSKYNVTLDDDGKPKGLKPDFDPEEWKSKAAKELTEPLNKKIEDLSTEISKRNESVIESAILSVASGNYRDDWVKPFGGDKPLVVKNFKDQFKVDETGREALVDSEGNFKVNGNGERIRAKDYLLDPEQFGDLLKDKRQRGSGFGNGGDGGSGSFTREQIAGMSTEEYKKNEEAINKALAEGKIK